MTEERQTTVAQALRQQRRKKTLTALIAGVAVITFLLGYFAGSIGNGRINIDNNSADRFSTFESVYSILSEKFYYGADTEQFKNKIMEDAIKGMVDAQGDIHTEYMTASELASFTGSLESSFVGIGVRYTMVNGNILVIEVLEESPAEKYGIKAGDFITAIEGVKCVDLSSEDIPKRISGERGTPVSLEILRESEVLTISVVRDEIQTTVTSYVKDGIGIVRITSFSTGTANELKKHLEKLYSRNVSRLIIDLRDNGGGYAMTLDSMCSYFMNNGEIVMIEEDRNGREIIDKVKNSHKYDYDKIVILVNKNSASCSEVFTLALKENCSAVVVGETTYGKGIAQVSKVFPDGSALKYTDVIWKSGNGVSIHGVGITPDYEVRLHDALYNTYLSLEEGELFKYDSVSEKVALAQSILDFLGYSVDRADGYFSKMTQTALAAFQRDNNFPETGELDVKTAAGLTSSMIYGWGMDKPSYDIQMNKAMEIVRQ